MTSDQLDEYLKTNYGRGGLDAFVADYNALAAIVAAPPLTRARLHNWLHNIERDPPSFVGPLTFEQALELVLIRKGNPEAVAWVYGLAVAVDLETMKRIEREAKKRKRTPQEWLCEVLEAGLKLGG